jgi:hypothetical protein
LEIKPTGQDGQLALTLTASEQIVVGAAFRERIARDITDGKLSHTDTEAMLRRLRFSRLFDSCTESDTTEIVDTDTMQEVAATVETFADETTAIAADIYNYGGEPRFANSSATTRLELGCSALTLVQEFAAAAPMYDSVSSI